MGTSDGRSALFDGWAATYDDDLANAGNDYPFGERDRVLDLMTARVLASSSAVVADLGCGTGAFLARLAVACPTAELWGVDFSLAMLARARRKAPRARFVEADMMGDAWTVNLPALDAVVSAYALHEVPDDRKVGLIAGLLHGSMARTGIAVIGDIGFPDEASLAVVRASAHHWDDDEYPWVAARVLPMLELAGVAAEWEQVGLFAGVLVARADPAHR